MNGMGVEICGYQEDGKTCLMRPEHLPEHPHFVIQYNPKTFAKRPRKRRAKK